MDCIRCKKYIKKEKEVENCNTIRHNRLCHDCTTWWNEMNTDERYNYEECDTCHYVFQRGYSMYCDTCKLTNCESCMMDILQSGYIACGHDCEEYMCATCFTYGIDNGFIDEEFKGMTEEGIMRLESHRFQKGI